MKKIADFFLAKLVTNSKFNSASPNNDKALLLPDFYSAIQKCISIFQQAYPEVNIDFTETYRSNELQLIHFKNGASKIKKNGMHHYGIAADCIFIVKGKRTYKGDITLLRKIYKENGLFVLGNWDPLHVQFIDVPTQQTLRDNVSGSIKIFQTRYNIPATGEADAATIKKAKQVFL
jgi:hypothetical protein